ncbi:MAG TPA: YbaN family protein [Herpetosiphonaceae bacterium]
MDEQITPPQTTTTPSTVTKNPLARWLWLIAGFIFVGLGGIGVLLPVMPSTVFFICAAACFAHSSPRFERWVLNLPHVGPMVRDYRSGLGMPRRAKIIAISTIAVVITLSSLAIPSWTGRLAAYGVALIGIAYIALRVPTRERVLAQRARLYDRQ